MIRIITRINKEDRNERKNSKRKASIRKTSIRKTSKRKTGKSKIEIRKTGTRKTTGTIYGIGKLAAGLLLLALFMTGCRRRPEAELSLRELTPEVELAAQEQSGVEIETETVPAAKEQTEQQREWESAEPAFCYVHICGEVKRPGVYKLAAGSRVYEAVELAGGFCESAAQGYVNQAALLEDGMKIVIPSEFDLPKDWELTQKDAGIYPKADEAGPKEQKVNLNTASIEQLCTLPGIGESRAKSIIAYREAHGGFDSPEEIMQVEGIKEGAYSKIKDKISIK